MIPRNVRLSEAPSHGKPITAYDRSSRGAEAYTALAAEFLKKQNKQSALILRKGASFSWHPKSPPPWAGDSAPCWAMMY